jgi:hypothetical protein
VTDLAGFLLARLDEQEANAHREMVDVRTMADIAAGRIHRICRACDRRRQAESHARRRP